MEYNSFKTVLTFQDFSPPTAAQPLRCELGTGQLQAAQSPTHTSMAEPP